MTTQTIKTVFQIRRDSTENWNLFEEIVPVAGEPCYDLDLHTLRVGDGLTPYKDLPVIGGVESAEDLQDAIEKLQTQVGDTNLVEIKESYTNLTTQVNEVQQNLNNKADTETVAELKTVVEQKVDTEAVDALEAELRNYIDEIINNVEVGNMDGGVIE